MVGLWWTIGLFAVFLSGAEILLRKLAPSWSAAFWLDTLVDGVDPEVARLHVDYYAGCTLAIDLGWAGTALLVPGRAYVLRRRLSSLRRAPPCRPGSIGTWSRR